MEKDLNYYLNLLSHPIIGFTNDLRFDFAVLENEERGKFVLTDTKSEKSYNGIYWVRLYDDKCNLQIRMEDFEIQFSTGYTKFLDEPFEEVITLFTKGLKGFKDSNTDGII